MSSEPEPTPRTPLRVAVLGGHGGAALEQIVRDLPAQLGLAIIVACAGGPDLADKLKQLSALPVVDVIERASLASDRLFIVPAEHDVEVRDGEILVDRTAARTARLDRLLRSLADTHGQAATGVILEGRGSHGALGIKRVKEAGGLTIAQSLTDGATAEMPRAAIATGMVDLVLDVREIGRYLSTIARAPATTVIEDAPGEPNEVANALKEILALLRVRTGHDFGSYKRATLYRRVARRMLVCERPTIEAYVELLRDQPAELGKLLADFLISVTNFFRDPEAFDPLADQVFPTLFAEKGPGDQVRVWVAGCATGEEAYSMAILLAEQAARMPHPPQLQVFATDIDEHALAQARIGRYPDTIAADVSPERLDRFFVRDPEGYQVRPELRERVLFSPHNVLRDPPFSRLGLISCRNLMIYLNRDAQDRVLNVFHFGLAPDGYLLLGASESADNNPRFKPIDPQHRLYQRHPLPAALGIEAIIHAGRWQPPTLAQPPAPVPARTTSFGEIHRRGVEQFAPPSLLVNDQLEVVHVSEHAGRYLQISGGEPSRQVLRLIHPALRNDLRGVIYAARQSKHGSDRREVQFEDATGAHALELRVRSVELPELGSGGLLVMMEELDRPTETTARTGPSPDDPVIQEMEHELEQTRHQLRTTIEQYETSVEELKASNEELQAINEELRSATEELETSKEELQSVNEELTTLNQELKVKIDEISHANSDLQNLMSSTEIGVVFLDRGLNIKRFTPRAQDVFNLIPSDIGRPLAHVTHRLQSDALPELAMIALQTLRSLEREVTTRDGRRYLARLLPYRSVDERIEGVVVTFVDVTDVKNALEARVVSDAAREISEERLRFALRGAPIVVLSLAHDTSLTWGYVRGSEIQAGASLSGIFAAAHAERFLSIAREVIATRTSRRGELDLAIQGESRSYDLRFDPTGTGATVVGFDITPSKLAEASLREIDRRKDEFLATLSHELRNPLTPLKVALDVLKLVEDSPEKVAISRGIMERQVAHLSGLVDDLLDLSRITQGKIQLDRVPLDPMTIVEAALEATRPLVEEHQHQLRIQLPSSPVQIFGDFRRLTQVLTNLLSNAIKYTPNGGQIDLEVVPDAGHRVLTIRVRDNGIGISPEMLSPVFEIFMQCRDEQGRSNGGLGIGLNLVRKIVELHGGAVSATSAGSGQGSEFVVELPLAHGAAQIS